MSRKLILLCVESNSTARTDYVYIESVIKRFYPNDRKTVYRPIFLGSKSMYNDKGKIAEINSRIKQFSGDTAVVYFIDSDDYDISAKTRETNETIKAFCEKSGYEFVFFCRDVEDVFLSKTISKDKVKCAEAFKRNNTIDGIDEKLLRCTEERRHGSNILNVLDKYFE